MDDLKINKHGSLEPNCSLILLIFDLSRWALGLVLSVSDMPTIGGIS